MKIDSKWLDKSGNIKPNSRDASSENPSSYNAIVGMMLHLLGRHNNNIFDVSQLNANKHLTNGGRYITNDYDIEKVERWNKESGILVKIANTLKLSGKFDMERSPDRFSWDETNAVVSSSFYFLRCLTEPNPNRVVHLNNLWNVDENTSQTFYRAYDQGAATRYAKKPNQNQRLRWQIEFCAKKTFNSTSLDGGGKYHASGKIQAWIRIVGLGFDLNKCTRGMPEEFGLQEVFRNYFPEADHPINVMAKELYK